MSDINEIQDMLARARAAVTADQVRPDAIRAIRTLELSLRTALDGHKLRDVPNLGSRAVAIHGFRVRDRAIDQKIDFGASRPVLVLADAGYLVMVRVVDTAASEVTRLGRHSWTSCDPSWHATVQQAKDDDLLAEDVEHVLRTTSLALTRHLAAAEGPATRFAGLRALAHRLIDVLQ